MGIKKENAARIIGGAPSVWGDAPSRTLILVEILKHEHPHRNATILVVGCYDGKFIFPDDIGYFADGEFRLLFNESKWFVIECVEPSRLVFDYGHPIQLDSSSGPHFHRVGMFTARKERD